MPEPAGADRAGWDRALLLAQDQMPAVLDTAPFRRRHGTSTLSWEQPWSLRSWQVLPLPPEFIVPRDRAEKQDCERSAAKRLAWPGTAPRSAIFGRSILVTTCLPASLSLPPSKTPAAASSLRASLLPIKTITEMLCMAPRWRASPLHLQTRQAHHDRLPLAHRSAVARHRGRHSNPTGSPSRSSTTKAKRTTKAASSQISRSPAITPPWPLAACGRARWKIENETFNVLKTGGYNLEDAAGHGKLTLAIILVTLNLLAFAFHTAAYLAVLAWRAAVIARGPKYQPSSICGPSPPTWCSSVGRTASIHRRGSYQATLNRGASRPARELLEIRSRNPENNRKPSI